LCCADTGQGIAAAHANPRKTAIRVIHKRKNLFICFYYIILKESHERAKTEKSVLAPRHRGPLFVILFPCRTMTIPQVILTVATYVPAQRLEQ
jgi:hypothetical protein